MPPAWIDQRETSIETRAYSIILNPNGLGAFLLLGALVTLSLALAPLHWLHRITMLALSGVLAAGIAVTFSRGAWLALVLGTFALAALAYRRLFAGLVVAALLAPVLAPRPFLDRITFALSERYIAQSLRAGRLLMWDVSLRRIVADPLFGSGLGTFGGTVAVTFGFHRLWVDNFYVQLAAEGGLILFFAFMWLLLRTGKGLVAATLSHSDSYLRAVSAGVFAGFVAVLFANLTTSAWETLAVGAGFWFLAGLASRPAEPEPTSPGGPA
jgi:O-antigen ligase